MENKVAVKIFSYVIIGFDVDETGMTHPREVVSPVRVKSVEGGRKVIKSLAKERHELSTMFVSGYEKRETVYMVPQSVIIEHGEIIDA